MITVVYPALNEEAVIRPALLSLAEAMRGQGLEYRAILVDDGSTDRTVAEAEAAVVEAGGDLELIVCRHPVNMGLGAGLRTGIWRALEDSRDDDTVVTLDADGTHPAPLILDLVAGVAAGADIVVASRYAPGATVVGVPRLRLFLSAGARRLMRVLFPMPGIRDYTCGFRATRVGVLRRARAVYGDDLCAARGFEATLDLLLCLRSVGAVGAEIPLQLDYGPRVGNSKMRIMRTIRRTLAVVSKRWIQGHTSYSRGQVRKRLAAAGLQVSR